MLSNHARETLQRRLSQIAGEITRLRVTADAARDRQLILRSTVGAGIVSGSNAYDQEKGKLPWMEFHEQAAAYLDRPVTKPKGIKHVAIARGFLKSEIGVHGMARRCCAKPESRNAIVSGTGFRAEANLSNVAEILKSERWQAAFPDVLFPPSVREAYTATELTVKHKGHYREPTVTALGIGDNATGMHVGAGSVAWLDDPVTKQNYIDKPEERAKIRDGMIHFISFVCDPGAEIWMTFTRWGLDDAYQTFLQPDGEWSRYTEPGAIILGCFQIQDNGEPKSLYPLRYCMEERDCAKPVVFRGKLYPVMRESLKAKERTMEPWEWRSQMLNDPQPTGEILFRREYFDHLLPCSADQLETWLDDAAEVKKHLAWPLDRKAESWLDRGELVRALAGDLSYEDKARNDWQVLLAAAQDRFGCLYILDAYYKRLGLKGLEEYVHTALNWRDKYAIRRPAGIETHGKEAMKPLADNLAKQAGKALLVFAKLPANSNKRKETRIGALEPYFRNGMVYWCQNTDWFRKLAMDEMSRFGFGASHDDIGDACANLLDPEVLPPRHGAASVKPYSIAPESAKYRLAG